MFQKFEKGNKFWQVRSKHGRGLLFSSPELMWNAACEYFEATDNRYWVEKKWVGKNADLKIMKTSTPYTWHGLCFYMGCSNHYFIDFRDKIARGEPSAQDFAEVVSMIEQTIYTHKFEGGMVGAYNPLIVCRDLGLVDKQEKKLDTKGEVVVSLNL